jgi:hypothetical protein
LEDARKGRNDSGMAIHIADRVAANFAPYDF